MKGLVNPDSIKPGYLAIPKWILLGALASVIFIIVNEFHENDMKLSQM